MLTMNNNECLICRKPMKIIASNGTYNYLKCKGCNWYSTVQITDAKENVDYDEYETFDNDFKEYERLVRDAERILNYKFAILGKVPESFLDIGTSEGVFVNAYNNISGTTNGCGVEVSRPKIDRAKSKGLNVVHFDDMGGDSIFDFILMRHVIEHIKNPLDYLKFISKWLSPGGVLCVETPHNDCWIQKLKGIHINDVSRGKYVRELYPPVHVCGFTPRSLRRIGGACGLTLMWLETYDNSNINFVYTKDAGRIDIPIYRRFFEKVKIAPNIMIFFKKS